MGFTLFGEKYKYEVDSINIGIFCPDGTLLIVLKLKDGTYKSIDVNLGAEKYKSLCKENDITNNVPVLVTQEHVNKLDKEMKPKYKWGDWIEGYIFFMDPFSCKEKLLAYKVRTNGKRVQVEFKGVKAMASCNIEAGDQFNYQFGKKLAERRLIAKLIEKLANDTSKINKTN
jgi:hypothetical protein